MSIDPSYALRMVRLFISPVTDCTFGFISIPDFENADWLVGRRYVNES